jgi:hypothetical protein
MKITVAVAIAALAFIPAAFANRPTIKVEGLKADGWGTTSSNAESNLKLRYPGIEQAVCYGAVIANNPSGSSFMHGLDRYWDKFVCAGMTVSGHKYALIYDQKSTKGWIMYRLEDTTLADLQA